MTRRLWAYSLTPPADQTAQERLTRTLHQHTQVTALQVVLAQRGDQTRTYLATEGCIGCLEGRCVVGCRTDLLTRTLRHTCPDVTLRHVPLGLAQATMAQRWLAWPTRKAEPLLGDLLTGLADARLLLHWQPALLPRQPATLTALLLADTPDAGQRLRSAGWQVVALPAWVPWLQSSAGLPPLLPPGRAPTFPPYLVTEVQKETILQPVAARNGQAPAPIVRPALVPISAAPIPSAASILTAAPDITWEPLPDRFETVLAEVEHETDEEREAIAAGLVVAVADDDEAAPEQTALGSAPIPDPPATNGHQPAADDVTIVPVALPDVADLRALVTDIHEEPDPPLAGAAEDPPAPVQRIPVLNPDDLEEPDALDTAPDLAPLEPETGTAPVALPPPADTLEQARVDAVLPDEDATEEPAPAAPAPDPAAEPTPDAAPVPPVAPRRPPPPPQVRRPLPRRERASKGDE